MEERAVIGNFVNHLKHQTGRPDLAVDRWPEDENRQSPEIDAIAGPYAIEHTTIDTLPNQQGVDDWFVRVVGGLDQALAGCIDGGCTITLKYDAIRKGMDLGRIRADLEQWILDNAPRLHDGSHEIVLPTSTPVNPPIVMSAWKGASRRIGFARFEPPDDTLSTRVRKILDRKAMKLARYQIPTSTTILLIENDDIALMNEVKMLDATREAYPDGLPCGVDEIWFADTSIPQEPRFQNFTAEILNG